MITIQRPRPSISAEKQIRANCTTTKISLVLFRSMHILKFLCQAIVTLVKQAWLLRQSVPTAIRQKRRQFGLDKLEAERLDRIRNPSKYLGK